MTQEDTICPFSWLSASVWVHWARTSNWADFSTGLSREEWFCIGQQKLQLHHNTLNYTWQAREVVQAVEADWNVVWAYILITFQYARVSFSKRFLSGNRFSFCILSNKTVANNNSTELSDLYLHQVNPKNGLIGRWKQHWFITESNSDVGAFKEAWHSWHLTDIALAGYGCHSLSYIFWKIHDTSSFFLKWLANKQHI